MTNPIRVRKDVPSGTVIIDRPEANNALNRQAVAELMQALVDFHGERQVRAVVITGAGESFCSGTDLQELRITADSDSALEQWQEDVEQYQALFELLLRYPKPVIAATSGWVVGLGVGLVAACDLVIAGQSTRFWLPESLRGLSAGLTVPLLIFQLSAPRAIGLLLTNQPATAAEAYHLGLVTHAVEDSLVWAKAQEIAMEIARGARESFQATKQLLNETVGEMLFTQLSIGAAQMAAARTTPAAEEGIRAFLEERQTKP